MFNFLRRKKKVESNQNELIDILVNYISEAKRLNWDDEEIIKKFKDKGYSQEVIDIVFKIYNLKGGKMKTKQKSEEEEDLDTEEEDLDEEVEDDDEPEKPVKKPIKKEEVKEEAPENKLTNEQIGAVLTSHENRLRDVESTLYKLRQV